MGDLMSELIPKIPARPLRLLDLPKEIRFLILRHLLLLPYDQTRVHRHIVDSSSLSALRQQLINPTTFHTRILRVCRALYEEASRTLAENHLVRLILPAPIDFPTIERCNVALWHIPSHGMTSVRPIMALDVNRGHSQTAQEHKPAYFFEMRDLHFVIRYILCTCRSWPHDFVDIVIHRIHVAGLCNASNAAERLFLRPLYPFLNGILGAIKCSDSMYAFPLRASPFKLMAFGPSSRRTSADSVMVDIAEAIRTHGLQRSTSSHFWDIKPALRIWDERQDCFRIFATQGRWDYNDYEADQSSVWEVTALRTLDEIQSQRERSEHPLLDPGPTLVKPNKAELLRVYREVKFFVGVGYLNLSYVPPTMLQKLHKQDVLSLSQPGSDSGSPTSFATQANAHFVRVPVLPDSTLSTADATDDAKAFDVCIMLALAETELIISGKGIHYVWRYLFVVFALLAPDYPASKLARRAMKLRMQLARKLWSTFHHRMKRAGVEDDGQLRGMWFRSNISNGMVKELMDKQLGQEAVAKYGEAVFAHTVRWVKGIQAGSRERILRRSSGCC